MDIIANIFCFIIGLAAAVCYYHPRIRVFEVVVEDLIIRNSLREMKGKNEKN
jgi:hypothetical protein